MFKFLLVGAFSLGNAVYPFLPGSFSGKREGTVLSYATLKRSAQLEVVRIFLVGVMLVLHDIYAGKQGLATWYFFIFFAPFLLGLLWLMFRSVYGRKESSGTLEKRRKDLVEMYSNISLLAKAFFLLFYAIVPAVLLVL